MATIPPAAGSPPSRFGATTPALPPGAVRLVSQLLGFVTSFEREASSGTLSYHAALENGFFILAALKELRDQHQLEFPGLAQIQPLWQSDAGRGPSPEAYQKLEELLPRIRQWATALDPSAVPSPTEARPAPLAPTTLATRPPDMSLADLIKAGPAPALPTAARLASGDAFLAAAATKVEAKDHQGAIRDLDGVIEREPQNAWAYLMRGKLKMVYHTGINYREALQDFDRSLALEPQGPWAGRAHAARATAKWHLEDWKGAIDDLDRAIPLDPMNHELFWMRARAKGGIGDLQGSIQDYDRAIALEPQNGWDYFCRGAAKSAMGDLGGALHDLNQAIGMGCIVSGMAHRCRGSVRSRLTDFTGALEDLNRTEELGGHSVGIHYDRGLVKLELSDLHGAAEDLVEAIERGSKNQNTEYHGRAYRALAQVKYRNGEYLEAFEMWWRSRDYSDREEVA